MPTHRVATQQEHSIADQALLEIVYLFVVPVVLVYVGAIPYSWRLLVLLCVSLFIMMVIRYQKWSLMSLGLKNTLRAPAVVAWGLFVAVGVMAVSYYAREFGFAPINLFHFKESWRLLLFFIPLSVLQEVAYRGFLTKRLKELTRDRVHRVLLSAALFTLLHVIYPYAAITLPIAFFGGLVFAALYEKYPDLFLACLAHSALNFTAVMFGLFS